MRLFLIGIIITSLLGAGAYVLKLQRDNVILKENAVKLESAISEQKTLIENQKKDFAEILEANKKINALVNNLKKDLDDLDKRFTKKDRVSINIKGIAHVCNCTPEQVNLCLQKLRDYIYGLSHSAEKKRICLNFLIGQLWFYPNLTCEFKSTMVG